MKTVLRLALLLLLAPYPGLRAAFESIRVEVTQEPQMPAVLMMNGLRHDYQACPAAEIDRPPVAIHTVAPRYAEDAEKQGVRGRIKVFFFIDKQGAVRMPAVQADAQPYLSTIAIKALRVWKFEPPTRRGLPVLVAAAQAFNFAEGQ